MKIGFIGAGNMGGAIMTGYAKSPASAGNEILLHDRLTEHNAAMAETIAKSGYSNQNIRICNNNAELAEEADIIIIGVKPNIVDNVLAEIAKAAEDKIIVSMAAGVSLQQMANALSSASDGLGEKARLIRIMPNTPAKVGAAMIAICRNSNVSDDDFARAKSIFDSVGMAEEVTEDLIDCVIGISGSSPAYTYMYIEALVNAGVANGMDADKAKIFACQAVAGAAKMALESKDSLEQLRINVCSPGGTTIEAVNKLFANGFMDDVTEAVQAAVDRSKEMTAE